MKGKLTISRPSYGDDREKINIVVKCDVSKLRFLSLEIDYADFAKCITGLSEVDCELEVSGLENVGKKRITEQRSVICPIKSYEKRVLRDWLINNKQEDGYILDPYLGSQSSIKMCDEGTVLNYRVIKYVEVDNEI
ncbi:hypothetical protein J9236_00095 [Providencia rettgeri]|uniref:hypothetical protein n=1 Tax=Providencia rettgeri TaxID=587 RepID=UPI001B35BB89|nr:hypothetical protein [Providencia rettgeri]MBQ0339640.1 hypothetical protein [Providencia rettgeri]